MRLVVALVASLAFANTAAAQYTVQTLPPPSGLPANTATFAYALNNRGQVFGIAFGTNGGPVLWTDGVPTALPVPAGYYFMHGSNASLLSDDGVAVARVGPLQSGVPANPIFGDILVWENGIPSFLPPVPANLIAGCSEYFGKTPFGINRAGYIFGMSHGLVDPGNLGSSPCKRFWIYKDGVFEMLPPSDPLSAAGCVLAYEPLEASRLNLLNNADHMALRRRPYNTRSGVDCDPLPPAPDPFPPEFAGILAGTSFAPIAQALAYQINNHDQVLLAPFAGSAFGNLLLWNGGTLVDFGTNVFAGSMNNLGEVALLVFAGSGYAVSLYGNGVTTSVILPPAAASIVANSPASPLLINDARQLVYSPPGQAVFLTPSGGAIADFSPPHLTNVPPNQIVTAPSAVGAIVNWTAPTADDDRDGPVPVVCSPSSGSLFPVGSTTVTCTATDGSGNLGSASFTVTVLSAPPPPGGNQAPIARSVVVATQEAVAKNGALVATDADGDALTFSIVTPPTKGTLSITDAATGAFTYTPNAGTVGYDTFTFQASDGTGTSTATGAVFIVAATPQWPGQTVRASIAPDGSQLNAPSTWGARPSADGRFVVFSAGTVDEVNAQLDAHVYVYDRQTGQTTLASKATGSDQSIGGVLPSISHDGRYVGFMTLTSGVPGGDPNAVIDAFIHDRQTGQTTRVNVASDGTPGNGESAFPAMSADGRYVAFSTRSTNLVAGDTDDDEDVYLRDRLTGQTTLVSVSTAGQKGNDGSWLPIISADGRYLSFWSEAANLVPGDTNGSIDVFVRDLWTGQTTRVSVGSGGVQLNDHAGGMLSADGRFVVLESPASNAVPGDTNGVSDVFVYDRQTGQTTRVSISSTGAQGMGESSAATISADGRYVAFRSSAPNLVPGDTNGLVDEFVHDRVTGQTVRVNVASDGTQANAVSVGDPDDGCCIQPFISADGRSVVIASLASNLVAGDTNSVDDVFVVGPVLVSPTTVNVSGAPGSHSVSVSVDYPGPWTATTTTPWITFTPPVGGSGSGIVSFTVAANPGAARTGTIVVALQTVTVNQGASTPPVAQNGTITTAEDTAVSGTLVATDPDGDAITYSLVTQPARGTVVLTDPSTGAFTYTPSLNRFGGDSFTFQAGAGGKTSNVATVIIDVTPVNDAPFAFDGILGATEDTSATSFFPTSDADSLATTVEMVTPPAHGTVTIPNPSGGALGGVSYTYTPSPNYNGPDSFTFRAVEAGLSSNIATVTITVAPVNDAPVATSVVITTQEGTAKTGSLLATDSDGDALTYSLVTSPARGTVTITNTVTGVFTYTPNAGTLGYDTFAFRTADPAGTSSTGSGMVFVVTNSPSLVGSVTRASVAGNGAQADAVSTASVLSADGRLIAFVSNASNLVADDTNGTYDVFVRNRQTGATTRVSVASDGAQGNSGSAGTAPSLSADGRYVAFQSDASNLVAGDTNLAQDVFVHDRLTGQTKRVSVASNGAQADQRSHAPKLSADGRFVAFLSYASNLVAGDTNGLLDVFVHDVHTGATTRVSIANGGGQANGETGTDDPSLSADGRYVTFSSSASNLVPGDTNASTDVFVHDRHTGQTTRLSVAANGAQANGHSGGSVLSADGRYVAFVSTATNLVPGDTNGVADLFVHDRQTGHITRVNVSGNGAQADDQALLPAMSADGRYVAFDSPASNLVAGDTNGQRDVFVHDRQTGQTTRASVTAGTETDGASLAPALSADGRYVAFDSFASNLVTSDTNGQRDVFVAGPEVLPQDLWVTSLNFATAASSIRRYNGQSGGFVADAVAPAGGLWDPRGMTIGPDFLLYVSSFAGNSVVRFNPRTGVFLGTFASGGGLEGPVGLTFGPDGHLYVASSGTNRVLKYDGVTGAFLGVFASGGLNSPSDLTFGPDANLYVANGDNDSVMRYDGVSGELMGAFVNAGSGGLLAPTGLRFGSDGNLYVAGRDNGAALKYDGATGAFLGTFATASGFSSPFGLEFGPDGNLYVVYLSSNSVVRFNGSTGAFMDAFVPSPAGGLSFPRYLTFMPPSVPIGTVSMSPTSVNIGSGGGTRIVDVSVDYPGTLWTASTTAPWITIAPPAAGFTNGTVSFTASPNTGAARTGTIVVALQTVTVNQDAAITPVAVDGSLTTTEDTIASGTLSATDPNGDAITFNLVTQPANGTAVLTNPSTGAFTYTPTLNFNGADSFTFQVTAGGEISNVATIAVTVTRVNDAPVADSGALAVTEDVAASGRLTAVDVDGDPMTFGVVSQPAHGAVVINATTGAFIYTPAANYNGADGFTFKAADPGLDSNVATVTIAVAPVNDAPVATNGTVAATEDAVTTGLLAAVDFDGDSLTFSVESQPSHGVVTITNATTGAYTYTPALNFNGPDSFTFRASDASLGSNIATVMVSVAAVNDPPQANSVVVTTSEGVTKSGVLLATDVDAGALTFSIVVQPTKGTLTITNPATGAFSYTPGVGTVGYDTFTFRVADGPGASTEAAGSVFIVAASPRWPGQTVRASVASDGTEGNSDSNLAALSADGRYVSFASLASNLFPNDTNGRADVFVQDRQTGATTRVSVASDGSQGQSDSYAPTLTPDGRYVAFASLAPNLVPNDTNNAYDIFVHDRQTGVTTRVSVATDGSEGNDHSYDRPSLSADGRYVAFRSRANLAAGDTNGVEDVFVHDRQTGVTTRVSVASNGAGANDISDAPELSADGRYVKFSSLASNLVAADTNGWRDVFVHDRNTGVTTRVSVASDGTQGNDISEASALSADGRYVAFQSFASNLVASDTNGTSDVFVHDRQTGGTTRVSVTSGGAQGDSSSNVPALSADGRYVTFRSVASNLVPGDTFHTQDVFVYDRQTGRVTRVSVAGDGIQGNGDSDGPAMSADGRYVAFQSVASNLVASDTNAKFDVFVVGGVSVSPATFDVPRTGGTRSVDVAFDYPGTPWTATTTTPWITINPPGGASSNGTVSFSVAPNSGAARSGSLVVALQTVTVAQEASTPPVAQNGTVTTLEDTEVAGTLVATDAEGDPFSYSVIATPAHGTVVLTNPATGAFTYTPAPNYSGADSFSFRADNGTQVSNMATVGITIAPVNDAPVASDRTLAAVEDAVATGVLFATDVDSTVTFSIVSQPAHGAVTINNAPDGIYTYTPAANFNGTDSFTFRASDSSLNSNVATVTIAVAPANDAPVASSIVVTAQDGATQSGVLPVTDIDGDALSFSVVTPPTKGTLTITDATTGAFAYTPSTGAFGYDTFAFRAADGSGASSSATAMVFAVASSPRWPGGLVRASVASNGAQANAESFSVAISADGRYTAFESNASNLVAGDTNGMDDVFVRDRNTGVVTRVSVGNGGVQANSISGSPALSADGRYVAFISGASNLVAGDSNGMDDVFVRDLQSGQTTRVGPIADPTATSWIGVTPALSADGRYVAFVSVASNVVAGDTNGLYDVFVFDRQTGQTTRVNRASDGTPANLSSFVVRLSADGRYVAFTTAAANLVAGDTNGQEDVFVHDRLTGQTTRASVSTAGTQANGFNREPEISADGRYVAFYSSASNLVAGDTNGVTDVFVRDLQTNQTTRMSVATDGAQASQSSFVLALSADARYVLFESSASNLVPGDTNARTDLFVRDRQAGVTTRVSLTNDGGQPGLGANFTVMSADGRFIGFLSSAANLVPSDTNGVLDAFILGGVSVAPTTINIPADGGSRSANVSFTYPGTPWTSWTTTPWITINPPLGGSANGTVSFSVAPNTGAARTGTLVVALQTVTVTQDTAPAPVPPTGVVIPVGSPVSAQLTDPVGAATPVSLTFSSVSQAGVASATPLITPPPGGEFLLKGTVWDVTTTAVYTPPITICFSGSFVATDLLLHYEGAWQDVTTTRTATQICGQVSSLSPFAIGQLLDAVSNQPPQATAGADQIVEATSSAGATVTLVGTGSDPDAGDTMTFSWAEGAVTLGTTATVSVVMPLGSHDVTLTVTDSHGATAVATTRVVVRDTTAPVVTPPAAITVPATEAAGARASAWAALAAYLAAGAAVDIADLAPIRLDAQVNGVNVDSNTLFAIGKTTTVTFRFRDASGNEGRATSKVTVVLGTPKIDVKVVNKGVVSGTRRFVDLEFTNRGDGNARDTKLDLVVLVPLKGLGIPKLVSPSLPLALGSLDAGATTSVHVEYTVPATVKALSISEIGTFKNVKGLPGAYLEIQNIVP